MLYSFAPVCNCIIFVNIGIFKEDPDSLDPPYLCQLTSGYLSSVKWHNRRHPPPNREKYLQETYQIAAGRLLLPRFSLIQKIVDQYPKLKPHRVFVQLNHSFQVSCDEITSPFSLIYLLLFNLSSFRFSYFFLAQSTTDLENDFQ